jgi:D-alanyl-D-alanine carboxypeptidase/D-alanyl-D-alanine-endopeptidase (penicillin-binding protein 4)
MKGAVRVLAATLVAGCAARGSPSPLAPEVRRLAAELDSAFASPAFDRAMWGVVVQSLDNGEVLYRRNAEKLFKPASNLKLVTGAVALVRLGPDFRYRTPVLARGARRGDTLAGDLAVIGRGDPSLSLRVAGGADILGALRPWADSLRARGIRVIAGRVAGDASWFPDPILGAGWMWDDLPYYYAAPIGALQFNEASAAVEIAPGRAPGEPCRATLLPSGAPLRVVASAVTAPADSGINTITFDRAPFTDSVIVTGRLSAGHAPVRLTVAVPDPTRYFEAALTQVLREAGITVGGAPATATAADTLFIWQSLPLRDLMPFFEKPSQNQIGEALLRTLGGEARGVASVDSGRATVRDVLRGFGIPDDAYHIADGSGVSHYNYVAPELLARVLFMMGRRPDAQVFIQALPIAGVDGTLAGRLRGTAAAGNAHAKTGDISGARTLSGYVTTSDGERLVFVLMANHFTAPRRVVDVVQDLVVERLANFRRGAPSGR